MNDKPIAQEAFSDLRRRAVAEPQPYRFGRRSEKKSELVKVGILGDDRKAVLLRKIPDIAIGGRVQSYQCHMRCPRKDITHCVNQNA